MALSKVVFPHQPAYGGPGSFQKAFEEQLTISGVHISYYPDDIGKHGVILVVNGTRKILWLLIQKYSKGRRIFLRLDGKLELSLSQRNSLNVLARILLIRFVKLIADGVIYQSKFSLKTWKPVSYEKNTVIYNGHTTKPKNIERLKEKDLKIVIAEGEIQGKIAEKVIDILLEHKHVYIFGKLASGLDSKKIETIRSSNAYFGVVEKPYLMEFMKMNKAVYFSLELNANCPNTVIEAMSFGLPIMGFKTGSMTEIVGTTSPLFEIDELFSDKLRDIINERIEFMKQNYELLSNKSFHRQQKLFSAKKMAKKYLKFMLCQCLLGFF